MRTALALSLVLALLPLGASAASFAADRTLVLSAPPEGNAYLAGGNVRVGVPIPADLAAVAGTLVVSGAVEGDLLIAGGTLETQGSVAGDVRAAGGHLLIGSDIEGDLVATGGVVTITGAPTFAHIVGGTVELTGGAEGPVEIYAANVLLAGTFAGDVEVTASDHVTVAENTVITGELRYNAPQQAAIPASARIGSVEYTGSAAFLPTVEEARTFALAGAGVFLVVHVISGLLAAGLVGGLFPAFTQAIAERALFSGVRRFFLLFLLGFALLIATPVLLFLLFVSFVGIGVALLLGCAYLMLLVLSYVYAAVLAGAALARGTLKRSVISWKAAIAGMLALQLIGLVPTIGTFVVFVLSCTAAGALASLAFSFAFPKGEADIS